MIRIANSSGYWGDDPEVLYRQVTGGDVDYVTADYLAEITMVILERQRRTSPERGFAYDFVGHLRRALPEIARRGVRIVANAGGVNLEACRAAVEKVCRESGADLPIAVVDGGDLLSRIGDLRERGVRFQHLDTGAPFAPIAERLASAHAYLGARPIAEALKLGARIVITGRVTDAALALGPMIHELGWGEEDWDQLAAGTIAGHILECGAQATGGNYTDFEEVPLGDWIGYPIVEIDETGDFVVTKHHGTGGLVNRKSVTEQLLYEIGDPRAYLTPDVVADFTSIRVEEVSRDHVRVSGARGSAPPPTLKISAVYTDGYRATGAVLVSGPRLRAKAARLAELVWSRIGRDFEDSRADLVGFDGCWLGAVPAVEPNEAVLRFAVRDGDQKRVARFSNYLLGFGLQAPPGLGIFGGRPEVQEAYGFWPTLVPREHVSARVEIKKGDHVERVEVPMRLDAAIPPVPRPPPPLLNPRRSPQRAKTRRARLIELAYARSGDKGDTANIGVAARSADAYEFLRESLTAQRVADHYRNLCRGTVERYELPNLAAFNFVLHQALGGGGTLSLRVDHQGKTLGQGLLLMEMDVPQPVLDSVKR